MTFESLECECDLEREQANHVNIWRRPLDRRNSKCKAHGAEMGFAGSRSQQAALVCWLWRLESNSGMVDYFQEFIPRNHISCESGSLIMMLNA